MIRILKYQLPAHGQVTIDANVVRWLHLEWVHGELFVWAEVSVHGHDETPMACRMEVVLTGDEAPKADAGIPPEFVGTAVLQAWAGVEGRSYVVHVYRLWP